MKYLYTLLVITIILSVFIGWSCSPSAKPTQNKNIESDEVIDKSKNTQETKVVNNSTLLILGQKIIDKATNFLYFLVIIFVVYKWVAKGKFGWLGDGR